MGSPRSIVDGWPTIRFFFRCVGLIGSASFFASFHDGGVEAFAESGGQIVDLMGAVYLDGFAGGVEGHFAVFAAAQVGFEFGARFGGHGAVDQVVEQGQKLGTGHFATPFFL